MADADNERFSLKRWSRRKLDAARVQLANPPPNAPLANAPAPSDMVGSQPALAPDADRSTPSALASDPDRSTPSALASDPDRLTPVAPAVETPLPPVDSLTFDSDFRGFMQPKVDETVKRAALKKLFNDPRFNVMDRLDTYIDDYSQPDPLPREWLRELASARNILNPPQTRVNDQGFAEDVPPERADAETASAEPEETPATVDSAAESTSVSDNTNQKAGVHTTSAVDVTDSTADTAIAVGLAASTRRAGVDTTGGLHTAVGADDTDRFPMPRKPG